VDYNPIIASFAGYLYDVDTMKNLKMVAAVKKDAEEVRIFLKSFQFGDQAFLDQPSP